ncbi:MAG: hypothetical protein K0S40_621 [Actinomycetospora sp.]|nr:hypothetical protein [Actinomycetospora sp.]
MLGGRRRLACEAGARLAPHLRTDDADIDRLVAALVAALR